jgi:RNA polymerase sigma-70 factor (ECF subfamily)
MHGEPALGAGVEDRTRVGLFEQHRRRLRALAYRMLGTVADAEDVVQEAYLRWHEVDVVTIRSAEAWLVAATTRLAIDRLRSVAAERRAYVGPWLPEPWLGAVDHAPDRRLERAADLSVAFLLLLERLTPEERAALILRDTFEVAYAEIAAALGRTEAACRQLVHRARARVRADRPRRVAGRGQHKRLLGRFLAAIAAGDRSRLLALLAPDAVLHSDGGGKVRAARNPIHGADRVARCLLGVARKQARPLTEEIGLINGVPGVVRWRDGQVHSTISIAHDGAAILGVYIVLNPDKLRHIGNARPVPPQTEH